MLAGLMSWFVGKSAPLVSDEATSQQYEEVKPKTQSGGGRYVVSSVRESDGYANATVTFNHADERRKVRCAYGDSDAAKGIITRKAETTVGTGLTLEPTPDAELLGISEDEAEVWAENHAKRFHLWANSKDSDYRGINTFYQNSRLSSLFSHRDNDFFVRLRYSNNPQLISPLQVEFIDPNQIRGDGLTSTDGIHYDDGIVRNAAGREVEYKVWVKKKDGSFKSATIPAKSRKGRVFMLHGYSLEYAGQTRGLPSLSHAIKSISQLGDFTEAQIRKAIIQSALILFNKPSQDADASNPLEGILSNMGAGPGVMAELQSSESEALESASIDGPDVEYNGIPDVELGAGSIGVFNLRKGEDLKAFENTAPSEHYSTFKDSFTASLSASSGMPYEMLMMLFRQNFSASRAALIVFWRIVQIWRSEIESDFLNPIYAMWLSEEIAAGRSQCPGWLDPRMRAAWLSCNWIGDAVPDIDPSKTSKARAINIDYGLTTIDREAQMLNRSSGKRNRRKLKKEFKELPKRKKEKSNG